MSDFFLDAAIVMPPRETTDSLSTLTIISTILSIMPKGKKHALDENEDEYKTANTRFKNPHHKTLDYTLTSASAESSRLDTVQKTRTIAYNPPTKPILVNPPQPLDTTDLPDSVSPDSKKKTQVSATM
jgi:hypothetical protein